MDAGLSFTRVVVTENVHVA